LPELPDIQIYLECLESKARGSTLSELRVSNPFLLRTVDPSPQDLAGKQLLGLRRLGKRLVLCFEDELFAVLHLMIAGRLAWRGCNAKLGSKNTLASFEFEGGSLVITESGSKRRASLQIVHGEAALAALDPGGLELLDSSPEQFRESMTRSNHTLKRALTDSHILAGIGNAYSDEILHTAKLSPLQLTGNLDHDSWERLHGSSLRVIQLWTNQLRGETKSGWPRKVTAFRPGMAVHGRYGQPCPVCQHSVQRIVYVSRETNYCAFCQTGGKLLADRALSALLNSDWPKTIEEWEGH
jgi:formamidopyrimidine-DNA glycosylase